MKTLPDTADWLTAERALEWEIDWILSAHHKRHLEFLLPRIKHYGVEDICDYGCGTGLLATGLPPHVTYLGVDKNGCFVQKAKARFPDFIQKQRWFIWEDVRDFESQPEWPGLSMAWNFLKNFGLHEWDQILAKILAAGRYAAFNVQTFREDMDDGTEYHHSFVTPERLEHAVRAAGHEIVEQVELSGWEMHGEMARDMAVWTQRK